MAAIVAGLLVGGGYWGWTHKQSTERVALAASAKARDTQLRPSSGHEVPRPGAVPTQATKNTAQARAQTDPQHRPSQAAPVEAAKAPASPAAVVHVDPPHSEEQRIASCADVQACVRFMLAGAHARRPDVIRLAASRIDSFDKPVRGDRKSARELNRQGLEALGSGDFAGASQLFERAAESDPRDVEIASNLGLALVRARRPDAATVALLKAVALDPRRSSAWAPMAEAFDLRGRADVAEASLLLAWEFSANKDKSLDYFRDRAQNAERETLRASFNNVLRVAQAGG
jgi:hypothetical protein